MVTETKTEGLLWSEIAIVEPAKQVNQSVAFIAVS